MLTSCQKEETMQQTVNNSADQAVLERILAFKTDVENPSKLKTNQTIAVEDAVWLVEAALNYTHCIVTEEQANAGADSQKIDSLFFDLDITNNQIDYQVAIDAFSTFSNQMQQKLNVQNSLVKFFTIADVGLKDNAFKLIYTIYYKENTAKSTFYQISKDWYWGLVLGCCDGSQYGRDATFEITRWVNSRRSLPANVYFTSVGEKLFSSFTDPFDYRMKDLTPYHIYMFKYSTLLQYYDKYYCLEINYNTYYASQTLKACEIIKTHYLASNEYITSLVCAYCARTIPATNMITMYHYIIITYGTAHSVSPTL